MPAADPFARLVIDLEEHGAPEKRQECADAIAATHALPDAGECSHGPRSAIGARVGRCRAEGCETITVGPWCSVHR